MWVLLMAGIILSVTEEQQLQLHVHCSILLSVSVVVCAFMCAVVGVHSFLSDTFIARMLRTCSSIYNVYKA